MPDVPSFFPFFVLSLSLIPLGVPPWRLGVLAFNPLGFEEA
jgi:hypothetical protein